MLLFMQRVEIMAISGVLGIIGTCISTFYFVPINLQFI